MGLFDIFKKFKKEEKKEKVTIEPIIKEKVVWRNEKGTIVCPGDSCPKECNNTCPIYLNTKAVAAMNMGRSDLSIVYYEDAIKIAPDFYDAWNNLGGVYGKMKEYEKAYNCYLKARELNRVKPNPVYGLILTTRDMGKYEECLKWCDKYAELSKDGMEKKIRKEVNEKLGIKEEKVEDSDGFIIDTIKAMGNKNVKNKKQIASEEYNKAIKIYNNASSDADIKKAYDIMGHLAKDFEYTDAIMWMGDFAEGYKKDIKEAGYWFKKAADLSVPEGARNYADFIMSGQIKESIDVAFKYYDFASKHGIAEASFVCGEIMRNNGRNAEALKYYQKALDDGYTPAQMRINQMK